MRSIVIGLAALLLGVAAQSAAAAQGPKTSTLFTTQCALCHMADPAARRQPQREGPHARAAAGVPRRGRARGTDQRQDAAAGRRC